MRLNVKQDSLIFIGMAIILLMMGLGLFTLQQATNSANDAAAKAKAQSAQATALIAELDNKMCVLALPSWIVRENLIIDTNEHSSLSPLIDPNTDTGRAFRAQIDKANKQRDERKARDLKENGPKPVCE